MNWGDLGTWDWVIIANIAGAVAAAATVLTALAQAVRSGAAFARYERWSRIRQDATVFWEKQHAEERRRVFLVEFVAASDSRPDRMRYVFDSLCGIAGLALAMFLSQILLPESVNVWVNLLLIAVILLTAVSVYSVPKKILDEKREAVRRAMGFDVVAPAKKDAPTPAELARELRQNDNGKAIYAFLQLNYPDHKRGSRWNLAPEQVRRVREAFTPK
ncbi:hypothetical protein KZX37_09340 [Microbacterium sp. EYE_5]|uniref:hypothetical protein n=1 Tax=unclassified Microbacterium TaxID=2609290 RepID=UPI00200568DD|nr:MULTISPECIES: hypothetical protein [unclassified Microbacterium]MCK6081282.1 hypothetical protein [Microbacterium sp. EYE_382]MCK6086552.1 hypothetical protein [Microbacterium sp. EYE_384]MCK6123950.1 hypothetical protein [Microbacterium sp. EYE_80]MCK6126859.1 hypothetical protein [Microbacterium sp. EYE_79]MCK6142237.1 hypothetical protein [Microbacterium sp. EYE_39]